MTGAAHAQSATAAAPAASAASAAEATQRGPGARRRHRAQPQPHRTAAGRADLGVRHHRRRTRAARCLRRGRDRQARGQRLVEPGQPAHEQPVDPRHRQDRPDRGAGSQRRRDRRRRELRLQRAHLQLRLRRRRHRRGRARPAGHAAGQERQRRQHHHQLQAADRSRRPPTTRWRSTRTTACWASRPSAARSSTTCWPGAARSRSTASKARAPTRTTATRPTPTPIACRAACSSCSRPPTNFSARLEGDVQPRAGETTNGNALASPTPRTYADGAPNPLTTDAATRLARSWFTNNPGYSLANYYGSIDNDAQHALVTGSSGLTTELNWKLPSGHTLTSITAYRVVPLQRRQRRRHAVRHLPQLRRLLERLPPGEPGAAHQLARGRLRRLPGRPVLPQGQHLGDLRARLGQRRRRLVRVSNSQYATLDATPAGQLLMEDSLANALDGLQLAGRPADHREQERRRVRAGQLAPDQRPDADHRRAADAREPHQRQQLLRDQPGRRRRPREFQQQRPDAARRRAPRSTSAPGAPTPA